MLLVATHGYFPKRKEQYVHLLIELLGCRSDKETEILEWRRGLLDEEFLELTQTLAKDFAETHKDIAAELEAIIPKIQQAMKLEPDNIARQHLKVEDPMMRCGLALAGANTWLLGGELPPEAGKGIIFAQDLAGIDLWATELVILVACESGLGDVKAGEGVFGLRRAFAVAGAKTLIMSLWKVPASATILLMDRFFDNLEKDMGRSAALKDAQNYLKNITARELGESELGKNALGGKNYPPESKPLAHPYYWGAWICQGDL
ncbi:MAG: CHAT domain-containing protein [Okeania sp. SIO2H7]|nr:CHAT domain-containing protein [Okeania sp. SIO2H7]